LKRYAFYAWKKGPLSAKAEEDKALTEVIKTSFNEGRECYGVLHTISCAKYAATFFKISRSWVNLRTCFFNRFISFSFDSLLATLVLPLDFEAL
jgi:hypothetical protein